MGDSYAQSTLRHRGGAKEDARHRLIDNTRTTVGNGSKPKDLLGMPWRLALALKEDGWFLRSDIIWHKPNPMPESVRDRPTKAHEYLFLLSKSPTYYYNADAIREPGVYGPGVAKTQGRQRKNESRAYAKAKGQPTGNEKPGAIWTTTGYRNKRDVWSVPSQAYKGAHFATFPPKLIEPCILAGCPEGGLVVDMFAGSGTVGLVARQHNRRYHLCELNPAYVQLAKLRLTL